MDRGPLEIHEQMLSELRRIRKGVVDSGGTSDAFAKACGELSVLVYLSSIEVAKLDPSFGLESVMTYDDIVAREA